MPDNDKSDTTMAQAERLAISGERGRILYGGDRVYLGSLDDSVSRYPWNGFRPSLAYLNKRLVDSVLFGAPISVRMGNLLFQDDYLHALLHPETSPLVELAKVGFVQFQMRSDSINESIATRVQSGTESALLMKNKHFWYHGSPSYEALAAVDEALIPGLGKLRYSTSFNDYFRAIMRESAGTATPAFQQVYDIWHKRPDEGANGRTRNNFEADAIRIFSGKAERVREAMWVANASNHYAYSLQFIDQGGAMPMVETTQFDRHAEVCATRHALPTELAEELLAKNKLTDPINVALSVISVPPAAYDPANAVILANLARHSSPHEDTRFNESQWYRFKLAKNGLTQAICEYLVEPQVAAAERVRECALAYNDVLGLAFGRTPDRSIGMYFRLIGRRVVQEGPEAVAQQVAGKAAEMAAQAASGAFLGNIVGFALGIALAIARVRLVPSTEALTRLRGSPDTPIEVDGRADDPNDAAETLARSAYMRYGSYVGVRTLNREKAARFRNTLIAQK